ncbi:ankyrin repeat-containing domain protein [Trichoderma sp. SZMC 28014]
MSSDTSISEATRACLQSFIEVEELLKDEWAENRLGDFNLWISGTGALADGRASLDHRLRDTPEERPIIANLLLLLAGIVDKCKTSSDTAVSEAIDNNDNGGNPILSTESHPERPYSPWSDESTSDDSVSDGQLEKQPEPPFSSNPLLENMQNIEKLLGYIAQVTNSVRQSGKRSRLQEADHLFRPEDYEDLKDHLSTIILARGEFSEQKIDPLDLDEIQRRLICCNLKRRNRFLYAQRHSERLNPVMPALTTQAPTTQAPATQAPTIQERAVDISDHNAEEEQKPKSTSSALETPSKAPNASVNYTIRTGTSASPIREEEVAELLLARGADTTAKDTKGWTPLLLAAYNGHEAIARLIIESGADTEARNNERFTPLLHAASNGRELENGANTEAKNNESSTPLLCAASGKSEAIVKLLLEHRADIEAKDKHGRTPLQIADFEERKNIIELFVKSSAARQN